MTLAVGDPIILNTPDNPFLHGTQAKIVELTEWGAHCHAEAAATKRFRASFNEMTPLQQVNGRSARSGNKVTESGYTGDCCPECGGCRMKRAGSCLTCDDCGSNSGCG